MENKGPRFASLCTCLALACLVRLSRAGMRETAVTGHVALTPAAWAWPTTTTHADCSPKVRLSPSLNPQGPPQKCPQPRAVRPTPPSPSPLPLGCSPSPSHHRRPSPFLKSPHLSPSPLRGTSHMFSPRLLPSPSRLFAKMATHTP